MYHSKFVLDEDNGSLFFQHLTLDNDGVTRNMNVDGTTPQTFSWGPASGLVAVVTSFGYEMSDAKNWDIHKFAGLAGALSNGLEIFKWNTTTDASLGEFTAGEAIVDNMDFYHYFPTSQYDDWGSGSADAMMVGSLDTPIHLGGPIVLKDNHQLRVIVNDNLTGLTKLHFYVRGYYGVGAIGRDGRK